jgi:hypothetical protein
MRELSQAQHARLDRLAERDPGAKVVGWMSGRLGGPVVRLTDGRVWRISPAGRAAAIRAASEGEVDLD